MGAPRGSKAEDRDGEDPDAARVDGTLEPPHGTLHGVEGTLEASRGTLLNLEGTLRGIEETMEASHGTLRCLEGSLGSRGGSNRPANPTPARRNRSGVRPPGR